MDACLSGWSNRWREALDTTLAQEIWSEGIQAPLNVSGTIHLAFMPRMSPLQELTLRIQSESSMLLTCDQGGSRGCIIKEEVDLILTETVCLGPALTVVHSRKLAD